MKLQVFDKQNKSELSMIEVAYAILDSTKHEMNFKDLYQEVGKYLGKKKREMNDAIVDFYTDLNIDGSFISLGNDIWGLRDWYPFESVDEETNHNEDIKEMSDKAISNYDEDDDIIDYIDSDDDETEATSSSITSQFDSSTLTDDSFLTDDEENQPDDTSKSADEELSPFSDEDDDDDL